MIKDTLIGEETFPVEALIGDKQRVVQLKFKGKVAADVTLKGSLTET